MDKRIGIGLRLLALLIDVVLVSIVSFLLAPIVGGIVGGAVGGAAAMPAGGENPEAAMMAGGMMGAMMGMMAAIGLIGTLYFLLEAFTGYTLGKLILGLRIGTEDGHAANMQMLLMRYAIKNIGTIMMLIAGISGVALFGTIGNLLGLVVFIGMFLVLGQARQTLHDKVAKTAVYRKADLVGAGA